MKYIKTVFTQLFMGANIATILLLWASCGVTYLPPAWHPHVSILALAFPIFLLVDVLFVFFWLIFKAKRVWLPLLGIACCFSFVRDYIPVNWPAEAPKEAITVVTYNTLNFGNKEANLDDGSNRVVNFLLTTDADIICLQESSGHAEFYKQFRQAGYECANISEYAICSRLPILSYDTLSLTGKWAHCMRAYIQADEDTIMLINTHLQSNLISGDVKTAYIEAIRQHESDSLRKGMRPVVELLANAQPLRAKQADSIKVLIDEWLPRPVILCGDFNDTPVSYAHRVLTTDLSSAFPESGNGLGFTFHTKGFPVRIDHILYSGDRWKSYESTICDTITCSDHFPIRTKLAKKGP